MRVRLIFDEWRNKDHRSLYAKTEGVELSDGVFHGGTTFNAEIELPDDQAQELLSALEQGYIPVFYALKDDK